ncbi:hypothetical protein F5887DRAFT_1083299 [Amanita rubescens]|nr:hypothetical protein F5887DRAFT_1083299 [Amanita rubescens]
MAGITAAKPLYVHTIPQQLGGPQKETQGAYFLKHPVIDGALTEHPLPSSGQPTSPWSPFENRAHFELAEFLYKQNQMSGGNIDKLMQIWAALHPKDGSPFAAHDDLYEKIDSIKDGDVPWKSFTMKHPNASMHNLDGLPSWQKAKYDVWFRDPRKILQGQLSNPLFKDGIDYAPKVVYNDKKERIWENFMSGNWAWKQCNILSEDPNCHGAMFVPIILGSDKTTVSIATGQHDYYPIYISNGNLHNHIRLAHNGAVSLLGFLPVPKGTRQDMKSAVFRLFRRKLIHSAIAKILECLKPAMSKPEVIKCADGQYRRAIYGIGPYIADYPEQCIIGCAVQGWCPMDDLDEKLGDEERRCERIDEKLRQSVPSKEMWKEWGTPDDVKPFTSMFPRADIHELIAPDLLHQVIKGTFKDHLVTWIEKYMIKTHGSAYGKVMMDEIDRRIAAVPHFAGLRSFSQGRNFKQWTGDDTKALMKVFLPAISGLVPEEMVKAVAAFLDFCYIVRQPSLNESDLGALDDALKRFCKYRTIFIDKGVCSDPICLPRQHSIQHYHRLIEQFGAPNGLSTSITESKHIDAVKKPWRRTNHFEELIQMLLINQRLDKLAAFRSRLFGQGLLDVPLLPDGAQAISMDSESDSHHNMGDFQESDDDGVIADSKVDSVVLLPKNPVPHVPRDLEGIAADHSIPNFPDLVKRFLYLESNPDIVPADSNVDISHCPPFHQQVHIYHSATCIYSALRNSNGTGGLAIHQRIYCTPSWRKGPPRYDCVFVNNNSDLPGFKGLWVGQVLLLFSIKAPRGSRVPDTPCALVQWFTVVDEHPCDITGMWMVKPEVDSRTKQRSMDVIHLGSIVRPAHLIPIYGEEHVPHDLHTADALNSFRGFYVNKFSDYHAYHLAF